MDGQSPERSCHRLEGRCQPAAAPSPTTPIRESRAVQREVGDCGQKSARHEVPHRRVQLDRQARLSDLEADQAPEGGAGGGKAAEDRPGHVQALEPVTGAQARGHRGYEGRVDPPIPLHLKADDLDRG
jgi:hypothetical protein